MSDSWANFGVDLLLDLHGSRRRASVESALRDAVRSGRLPAGTALPSSRALAVELGLARNTVADAYGQLVAEGWLTARQGSGTRVAQPTVLVNPAVAPSRPSGPSNPSTPSKPSNPSKLSEPVARRRLDLTPGTPDLAGFPRTAWLAAGRRALTAVPNDVLGYPDPRGLPSLREALAQYLARVRGVRTTPDRIVICSGFVQALSLLAGVLKQRGASAMAVESHGLGLHRELIRAAGLDLRSLPVDGSGARTDELTGLGTGIGTDIGIGTGTGIGTDAEAVLLTPAHQFPLGVPLTSGRRAVGLQWAGAPGRLVIEDDYDGEFRYDRKPIGALQGLAPESVAYIGTASKSLAPALGLAWLVVPGWLVEEVVEAKRLSDGYTGILEQLTFSEFVSSGAHDRHVRRSRLRYRRRRDQLLATLAERKVDVTVSGIAAGLHAVLGLPGLRAADERAIVTRAARAGLDLKGLSFFRAEPDPDAPAGLVVGYATPPDHSYPSALDALCDVLT